MLEFLWNPTGLSLPPLRPMPAASEPSRPSEGLADCGFGDTWRDSGAVGDLLEVPKGAPRGSLRDADSHRTDELVAALARHCLGRPH